jgi:DNA-binding NarL/FixJ family response regulator
MTSGLIIDDHPVVLQGLRRVLEDAGSFSRSSRNASRRPIRTTKERLMSRNSKALQVVPLRVS